MEYKTYLKSAFRNLKDTGKNLQNFFYQSFEKILKGPSIYEFDFDSYDILEESKTKKHLPDYSQEHLTDSKVFNNQAKKNETNFKVPKEENPLNNSYKQKDNFEVFPPYTDPISQRSLNIPESHLNRSILSPLTRCCICEQYTASIGFLCNHYYCENCLADICCNQMLIYTQEINNGTAENKRKFSYRCFEKNCFEDISVPTRKVVKIWLENKLKYDTQGYREFFQQILQNHIPLFDGVSC